MMYRYPSPIGPWWRTLQRSGTLLTVIEFASFARGVSHEHWQKECERAFAAPGWSCVGILKCGVGHDGCRRRERPTSGRPTGSTGPLWRAGRKPRTRPSKCCRGATRWTRPSGPRVLSVTDAQNFCFGGEVPIMVFDAKRNVVEVLSGKGPHRGWRPWTTSRGTRGAASRPWRSDHGGRPRALDACLTALDRYGTLTFAETAQPAPKCWSGNGRAGRPIWPGRSAGSSSGENVRWRPRRGLRLAADYFYRRPIAREIDAWSRQQGGLLRYPDLATHVTRVEEPVVVEYRGHTIVKCGPWTQGPMLLETLQLEKFDLKTMGHNRPDYVHAVVEAMKLGLADRDTYYADPSFVDVPLRALFSPEYADLRGR